jgi:probable O-glycosylation ligase (exosortase A-associated)
MKGIAFTYLMTYGGSVLALWRPYYGLLIYVCFAIIKPDAMWEGLVPPGNYSRTVGLALLAGWALHGFGRWQFGRARALVILLLVYFLWLVITAGLAPFPDVSFAYIAWASKVILPILVGITMIDSTEKLKQLAWTIVISQGYVAWELNLAFLHGRNRVHLEGFAGSDNNCVAIAMVTCMGLAFFLGMGARQWWRKGLAFFCAALMAHVVMFAYSRGGMLAMGVTGVMAFFLIPKKPQHYLAFAGAILVAVRLAGPRVRERFATTFASQSVRDASAQSRLDLWRDCMDAAINNPIFGIGPDHWPIVAERYGWLGSVKEAHSVWVQLTAELGFPGVLLLLTFFGICIVRLWPLTRERQPVPDPWMRDAARMVIAALIGFAVAAQFVSVKKMEVPYYIALLGMGVLKLSSMPAAAAPRVSLRRSVARLPRPASRPVVAPANNFVPTCPVPSP